MEFGDRVQASALQLSNLVTMETVGTRDAERKVLRETWKPFQGKAHSELADEL